MSYILTSTGSEFRYDDIASNRITIEDIAHALSNQCRFSGHTRFFYSVAEHSVHVMRQARRYGLGIDVAALLHDAAEAAIVDVPRPLKYMPGLDGYRAVEACVEGLIRGTFGFELEPWAKQAIKRADRDLLVSEAIALLPDAEAHFQKWSPTRLWWCFASWPGIRRAATWAMKVLGIRFWSPAKARRVFLREARRLGL